MLALLAATSCSAPSTGPLASQSQVPAGLRVFTVPAGVTWGVNAVGLDGTTYYLERLADGAMGVALVRGGPAAPLLACRSGYLSTAFSYVFKGHVVVQCSHGMQWTYLISAHPLAARLIDQHQAVAVYQFAWTGHLLVWRAYFGKAGAPPNSPFGWYQAKALNLDTGHIAPLPTAVMVSPVWWIDSVHGGLFIASDTHLYEFGSSGLQLIRASHALPVSYPGLAQSAPMSIGPNDIAIYQESCSTGGEVSAVNSHGQRTVLAHLIASTCHIPWTGELLGPFLATLQHGVFLITSLTSHDRLMIPGVASAQAFTGALGPQIIVHLTNASTKIVEVDAPSALISPAP